MDLQRYRRIQSDQDIDIVSELIIKENKKYS